MVWYDIVYELTDLSLVDFQLERDLEWEEKLVFLKDARTAVVIDVVRVRIGDVS